MNILITGGAGFVGSSLCKYLLEKYPSYQITILDNLSTGSLANLGLCHTNPNFQFYIGSVTDLYMVELLLEQADLVINLADSKDLHESVHTNCVGVQTILYLLRSLDKTRFIQISDYSVYGGCKIHSHREEDALQPMTPHASTKAAADQIIMGYAKSFYIDATIIRPATLYGPFQDPKSGIANVISSAIKGTDITVPNGNFELLYIKDFCNAVDRIIHSKSMTKIFNIGSRERCNLTEIAHMVTKSLKVNTDIKVERVSRPVQYAISSERSEFELGKYQSVSLKEGINRTINWYLTNKQWWRTLASNEN